MARKMKPVRLHKIPHATERELIDALIASGTIRVTRYAECPRPRFRSKHGGALPAHLNPVTLGEHDRG